MILEIEDSIIDNMFGEGMENLDEVVNTIFENNREALTKQVRVRWEHWTNELLQSIKRSHKILKQG